MRDRHRNDQGFGKYTFECGPGTVFDPSEITCNHPWNLDPADACYSSPPSLNIASKKTTPLANVGNAERKEAQAPIGKHGVKSKDL